MALVEKCSNAIAKCMETNYNTWLFCACNPFPCAGVVHISLRSFFSHGEISSRFRQQVELGEGLVLSPSSYSKMSTDLLYVMFSYLWALVIFSPHFVCIILFPSPSLPLSLLLLSLSSCPSFFASSSPFLFLSPPLPLSLSSHPTSCSPPPPPSSFSPPPTTYTFPPSLPWYYAHATCSPYFPCSSMSEVKCFLQITGTSCFVCSACLVAPHSRNSLSVTSSKLQMPS